MDKKLDSKTRATLAVDALHDAANVVLSAFAKAYERNGCCLSEIQDEYGADGCMFRGLDVTHGDVAKLRDALARVKGESA